MLLMEYSILIRDLKLIEIIYRELLINSFLLQSSAHPGHFAFGVLFGKFILLSQKDVSLNVLPLLAPQLAGISGLMQVLP